MENEILKQHYGQLRRSAIEAFEKGRFEIDPNLSNKQADLRRGITLVIRLSPNVVRRVSEFLAELAAVEPNQYFYSPNELHVTVLSLFSATADYQPYYDKQFEYLRAADAVLSRTHCFGIEFRGVTASPGAIMLQGFPKSNALDELRNRLRRQLADANLSETLDRRYKIKTAHSTVFRFKSPPADATRFLKCLRKFESYNFGDTNVDCVQMVKNDWYMSQNAVSLVKEWKLI